MRVRTVRGVKRVTIIGPAGHVALAGGRVAAVERRGSAVERLRFSVIQPDGVVKRGELRLELGDVKKSTRMLRPVERRLRKLIRAEYKALGQYLMLHDRSRRKRRNGWASDFGSNVVKVIRRNT